MRFVKMSSAICTTLILCNLLTIKTSDMPPQYHHPAIQKPNIVSDTIRMQISYYDSIGALDKQAQTQKTVVYATINQSQVTEFQQYKDLVMRVVAAEARGESYDGQRAVAQTIYDRTYRSNGRFGSSLYSILTNRNQYAKPFTGDLSARSTLEKAVCDVFVNGELLFDKPTQYFYVNNLISERNRNWFETKAYVATIGVHTFRGD